MEALARQTQFDFSDEVRCNMVSKKDRYDNYLKTGTTICGLLFKDGVILAADTRSTGGTIVANKRCNKIHYVSEKIYCCGAGTAADADNVTDLARDQLTLLELRTARPPRVSVAANIMVNHLFRYQGGVSAALILGGVDIQGCHLISIHPHGSYDRLPYVTLGSGSLAAQQVLDTCYKPDLTREQAMEIAVKAITAGIINDMGSGSNVDVCVITREGTEVKRPMAQVGDNSAGKNVEFQ